MATLADNNPITSNGIYTLATYRDKWHKLRAAGTFDGATVKLETINGSNTNVEVDSTNTTWTAAGSARFLSENGNEQLNVTGAGGSTSIEITFGQF